MAKVCIVSLDQSSQRSLTKFQPVSARRLRVTARSFFFPPVNAALSCCRSRSPRRNGSPPSLSHLATGHGAEVTSNHRLGLSWVLGCQGGHGGEDVWCVDIQKDQGFPTVAVVKGSGELAPFQSVKQEIVSLLDFAFVGLPRA